MSHLHLLPIQIHLGFSHLAFQQAVLKSGFDDFDVGIMLTILDAAFVELQNMDLLSNELLNIVRHDYANRKSYYKLKTVVRKNNGFQAGKP